MKAEEYLNAIDNHFTSFLFKGPPKAGKSIAAISFPRPIFIFDMDGRIRSVLEYLRKAGMGVDGIEFETYLGNDYEKFDKKLESLLNFPEKFKTVCVDSLTNFAELALGYFVYLRGMGANISGTGRAAKDFARKGVVDLLEVQDYGGEDRALMNTMRLLLNPKNKWHFILTAHTIEIAYKDVTGTEHTSQTLLTGGRKIAAKLPSLFNEVYHFVKEPGAMAGSKGKHLCNTVGTGFNWAGSCYGLPAQIDYTDKMLFDEMTKILDPKGVVLSR